MEYVDSSSDFNSVREADGMSRPYRGRFSSLVGSNMGPMCIEQTLASSFDTFRVFLDLIRSLLVKFADIINLVRRRHLITVKVYFGA